MLKKNKTINLRNTTESINNIRNKVNFPTHDACPSEFVAVHEYEPASDVLALAIVKTYQPSFNSFNEYLKKKKKNKQ
jgi:hypothetical protein